MVQTFTVPSAEAVTHLRCALIGIAIYPQNRLCVRLPSFFFSVRRSNVDSLSRDHIPPDQVSFFVSHNDSVFFVGEDGFAAVRLVFVALIALKKCSISRVE